MKCTLYLFSRDTEMFGVTLKTSRGDLNLDIGPKSFTSVVFTL